MQPFRGTYDLLPEKAALFRSIVEKALSVSKQYGFEEVMTPIIEKIEVFARTLGASTDIVSKEMFTLEDRNGDLICLRPEGTAGVMRCVLSNKLTQEIPLKYFYEGPMFRYERPQKGRQRQFHQLGVELMGDESYRADVEVILLAKRVLKELGLLDRVTLEINSLGDGESRASYRQALVDYLSRYKDDLSEDSQKRLENNPLRILDSKNEKDQEILNEVPAIESHFNKESAKFFEDLCKTLSYLGVSFVHNNKLVRGLDYYAHSVFEFTTTQLGSQSTVLAGGRYNGLSEAMGGPNLPSVGWAAGIERLMLLTDVPNVPRRPIFIIPVSEVERPFALALSEELRDQGFDVSMSSKDSLKAQMKRANKLHAQYVLLLGEEEIQKKIYTLKDLDSGEQEIFDMAALLQHLKKSNL